MDVEVAKASAVGDGSQLGVGEFDVWCIQTADASQRREGFEARISIRRSPEPEADHVSEAVVVKPPERRAEDGAASPPELGSPVPLGIRDLAAASDDRMNDMLSHAGAMTDPTDPRADDGDPDHETANADSAPSQHPTTCLTVKFGKGFDQSNLPNMRAFFQSYRIRDALHRELPWNIFGSYSGSTNPTHGLYLKPKRSMLAGPPANWKDKLTHCSLNGSP